MKNMASDKLITFLDSVQRTIIAEKAEEQKPGVLRVKNPVVVNIVPQIDPVTQRPTASMALQLIPLYFREFLGDKREPVYVDYPEDKICLISFAGGFDFKLYAQYDSIFNPSGLVVPNNAGVQPAKGDGKVIKLFED